MPNIGPVELIIILVIALIVIGPGRLPDVGAALGKSIREFRKASSDITDAARVDVSPQAPAPAAQAAPIAAATAAAAPAVSRRSGRRSARGRGPALRGSDAGCRTGTARARTVGRSGPDARAGGSRADCTHRPGADRRRADRRGRRGRPACLITPPADR